MMNTVMADQMVRTESKQRAVPIMLQVEGSAVLIASILAYSQISGDWGVFAILLLSPDLAFIGYLIHKSFGVALYNLVHTYTSPILLAILAYTLGWTVGLPLALIWFAHIGMDRSIKYGLKYSAKPGKDTHLQQV